MRELPAISCTQKLVLYETKARFYVVGSNNAETKFRVLKIDRTEPLELVVYDDKVEYTGEDIKAMLMMIESGNRTRMGQKANPGVLRSVSAFGIVGYVRFLEGYYIILITKRRKAALIGPHTIYKIEDTTMLYIPNDGIRYTHPDESRYVRMFQNVDLSSNFYFSYSYDLTHTLQYNMAPSKLAPVYSSTSEESDENRSFTETAAGKSSDREKRSKSRVREDDTDVVYGIKNKPTNKFVWNAFLLKLFKEMVHLEWFDICVFGKPLYLTLIARRSNQFAGTRFLKRGANCEGAVANEVETEQIVHDASVTFLNNARITSFVQLRGSIPLFWSQDIAKMVPRPPIVVDQADPYAYVAGLHFSSLLTRFGAPVIVVNLVKMREKRRHESILSEELMAAISYLNQFLSPEHSIRYIGFDMARVSKRKDASVMSRLAKIAKYCVKQTGFYFHAPHVSQGELWKNEELKGIKGVNTWFGKNQTGVVRVNCVDCLDRTNTAQFAMGKCALGYQLYAMGVTDSPTLEFDTDCVRMLEELYENQGNTLALQYGGSQLVHRIKGYRKVATWTYHSRDFMQTISRYYSNAFSDAEKQQSINLFLGVFVPKESQPNLWELPTDYYLHNRDAAGGYPLIRKSYCQWWDLPVSQCLPLSYEEESKGSNGEITAVRTKPTDERVNEFWEHYKPYELTSLEEQFGFSMTHSIRNVMPKHATDYSPFSRRISIERQVDDPSNSLELTSVMNKDVPGMFSSMSSTSEGSSSTDSDEMEGDVDLSDDSEMSDSSDGMKLVSFQDLFPSVKEVYDFQLRTPVKRGLWLYQRYEQLAEACSEPLKGEKMKPGIELYEVSAFKLDSVYKVELAPASKSSRDIYTGYVLRGHYGAGPPTVQDMSTYMKYLSNKYL